MAISVVGFFCVFANALKAEETTVSPSDSLAEAVEKNRRGKIVLKPGVHRLAETLVLSRKNSGLTIEAENPAQRTIVTSAHPITSEKWQPYPEIESAWQTKLPDDFPNIRTLFFENQKLPRARSRGFRQLDAPPTDVPFRGRRAIDEKHAYLPRELFSEIKNFDGAELRLIPKFPWVCHVLPISKIDLETGLTYSAVQGTYPVTRPAFGHFPDGTAWIENSIDVLDTPGEWIFSPETRLLILKTPDGKPPGDRVEIPKLTELIRIEGRQNEFDLEDDPVRNVTIRGIQFEGANTFAWPENKVGRGLQHDWEMHDMPTAMVRLRFAENCRIENCRFVRAGATGLRFDLHCRKNLVRRCEFAHLGGAGIVLAGYGLGFKDVNRENLIADNHIHHIGEFWWHSPGIFAWQSGRNRIHHNRIHHLPHNAITISGRTQLDPSGLKESSKTARMDEVIFHLEGKKRTWENREPLMHGRFNDVIGNDIFRVMEFMADGNAIYISGTGRGNRVRENFIHDIAGPNMNGTIRCDDDQHEVTIERNVMARCAGEGILWKGRCDIVNNLIFALQTKTPDGNQTQHQRGFLVLGGGPVTDSIVKRNLFFSAHPRLPILFERDASWVKHGTQKMPPVRLADADSDRNWFWNSTNPNWADDFFETQRARGIELHSILANPNFVNPKANDFTIQNSEAAKKIGFEPLDFTSKTGPRDDSKIDPSAKKVLTLRGKIEWADIAPFLEVGELTDINAENCDFEVALLGEISSACTKLKWLNLYQTKIGDDGARVIGEMRSLTHLPAGATRITNSGLAHFSELENIEYLGLRGNEVSLVGLRELVDLKKLTELNLAETKVDNAAVKLVAKNFSLTKLWLHDTKIDDTALKDLGTMKSLKQLFLQRTQTTAPAIQKLREALPDCKIFWESDP